MIESMIVGTVAVTGAALIGYRLLRNKSKTEVCVQKSNDNKITWKVEKKQADPELVKDVVDGLFKEAKVPIGGGSPTTIAAPITINVRTIMMVLISLLVLSSSLFIILFGDEYGSENQKWAFGVVGSIMGFWLRPEKT